MKICSSLRVGHVEPVDLQINLQDVDPVQELAPIKRSEYRHREDKMQEAAKSDQELKFLFA